MMVERENTRYTGNSIVLNDTQWSVKGVMFKEGYMFRNAWGDTTYRRHIVWDETVCGNCGTKQSYKDMRINKPKQTYDCAFCVDALVEVQPEHFNVVSKDRSKLGKFYQRFKIKVTTLWIKLTH